MKQSLITDYFSKIKIFGYNEKTGDWHCCECGKNMGPGNSRQLCGKFKCENL